MSDVNKVANRVIVANSTGVGAIAVIRVSGDGAFEVVERVYSSATVAFATIKDRRATLCKICYNNSVIDTVLLTKFTAPHSFSGEDMVEISCHGGRYVPAEIIEALIKSGARMAEAGEFSRRAFLNGKLDLTQAEGIVDLINAESSEQATVAKRLLNGELATLVNAEYNQLLDALANVEASLDYPDEDLDPINYPIMQAVLQGVLNRLTALAGSYGKGRVVKDGFKVVLTGLPNAGKSSLFNRLAGSNAIVTHIAGTTTDTKTEVVVANGTKILYTDTAGLRETQGLIEQMGVELAQEAVKNADLVLEVVSACERQPVSSTSPNVITVYTKIDLLPCKNARAREKIIGGGVSNSVFYVSSVTGEGIDSLAREVASRAGCGNEFLLTNLRHYQAVVEATRHLEFALDGILNKGGDVLAVDIRIALEHLGKITGRTASAELLNAIFSKFCLGK